MRCKKCGKENRWNAVTCKYCGARMELGIFTYSLVTGGAILFWGSFAAMFVSLALAYVGVTFYESSLPFTVSAFILSVFSISTLIAVGRIGHRRHGMVLALSEAADAKQKPPASLDQLTLTRAKTELTLYRGTWRRLFAIAGILLFLVGGFQLYLVFASPMLGPPDATFLTEVLFLEYGYFFGTVAVFLRYPPGKRIRENISSWRNDPLALVPLYVKGHKEGIIAGSRFIGPRSIAKPLERGLIAIWVTVLLALFLAPFLLLFFLSLFWSLFFWSAGATLLALVPYEYILAFLGFVGMTLHRLRATRAVGSALAEHATKTR
jgi:hypothetical protein